MGRSLYIFDIEIQASTVRLSHRHYIQRLGGSTCYIPEVGLSLLHCSTGARHRNQLAPGHFSKLLSLFTRNFNRDYSTSLSRWLNKRIIRGSSDFVECSDVGRTPRAYPTNLRRDRRTGENYFFSCVSLEA